MLSNFDYCFHNRRYQLIIGQLFVTLENEKVSLIFTKICKNLHR